MPKQAGPNMPKNRPNNKSTCPCCLENALILHASLQTNKQNRPIMVSGWEPYFLSQFSHRFSGIAINSVRICLPQLHWTWKKSLPIGVPDYPVLTNDLTSSVKWIHKSLKHSLKLFFRDLPIIVDWKTNNTSASLFRSRINNPKAGNSCDFIIHLCDFVLLFDRSWYQTKLPPYWLSQRWRNPVR